MLEKIYGNKFTIGDYIVDIKRLGKGAFSSVYHGKHIHTNKSVAIKKIELDNIKKINKRIKKEIKICKTLKHPNIVETFDVIYDKNYGNIYMILEYCDGGDLNKFLKNNKLNEEGTQKIMKQIAMALMLVVECGIRIGSEKYRDENKSFGATTLEPRHFKIKGEVVSVDFIGKKGVRNTGKVRSKRLSRNLRIKKRTFRSNEPIFSYRRNENWYTLKSIDVNKYLKKFGNFSSKNFRTWVANLSFITELLNSDKDLSENQKKKYINSAIKKVAEKLNNTIGVCKKNYIDPSIINIYLTEPKRFFGTFKNTTTKEEVSEKYIELLRTK